MPRTLCALALLGTLLSSLGPPSATPALLVVPDQYSTIQSAITAAAGGDSILVRAGTYVESLGWSGKDLTLLGEPPGTILTTNHTARVLDLGAGVTPATVLEGLVISDGQAEEGGGIRLRDGGSAQIRWCRFTSNRAASSQSTEGGAMYVDSGSVVIDDCFFGSNSAYNSTVSESAGGAIFATGANITIRRCTFDHNGASGFEGGPGGAIFLGGGVASLDSCTFSDNDGGTGAAIYSWACLTVTRSTFRGNFSGAGGSAIACDFGGRCAPGDGTPSAGSYSIIGNVLFDNFTAVGATIVAAGPGEIRSNTLAFNQGNSSGAGITFTAFAGGPIVSNNIVALNQGYGMHCSGDPDSGSIACNDVWSNEGNYAGDCPDLTGQFGNISLDPLFCDGIARVLTINASSPCAPASSSCGQIGALGPGCGITPTLPALAEARAEPGCAILTWFVGSAVPGTPRVYRRDDGTDWAPLARPREAGNGALTFEDRSVGEGRYAYRLGFASGAGEIFTPEVWVTVPARPVLRLAGFRPNPATGEPVVLLSLQSSEHARLDLFDMTGRQILSKDLRSLGPGEHAVTLGREVSPPPGVYWLRLAQGGRTLTARGLVLR